MDEKYYLYFDDKQQGPYTKGEIKLLLKTEKVNLKTFAWKAGLDNWIKLGEFKEFSNRKQVSPPPIPKEKKPKGPPEVKPWELGDEKRPWLIYDQNKKKGPFSKNEILKMLHNQKIRRSTYAFREGMEKWEELIYIEDFREYFREVAPDIDQEIKTYFQKFAPNPDFIEPGSYKQDPDALGKEISSIQFITNPFCVICEDSDSFQNYFRSLFARGGINYMFASSAKAAIQTLKDIERLNKKVDFLVVDILMPDREGFEFLKAVYEMPNFQDILIISTAINNGKVVFFKAQPV